MVKKEVCIEVRSNVEWNKNRYYDELMEKSPTRICGITIPAFEEKGK